MENLAAKRMDRSCSKETKQKTVKDGGKSNDLDHEGKVARIHNYYICSGGGGRKW